MKIAVTGYKGRLGGDLVRAGCTPLDCDITKPKSIQYALRKVKPDIVINCAAFTDVDACEDIKTYNEKALSINYFGPNTLRDEFDGWLIHISTDFIFNSRGKHREDSVKFNPVNNYGLSKGGAEFALNSHPKKNTTIVRTTGLYGSETRPIDFVGYILGALENNDEVRVARDFVGNNTYVPHLVGALSWLCNQEEAKWRIIHLASKDILSKYDFAIKIANVFGYDPKQIVPVKQWEIEKFVAARPKKGGLDVRLAERNGAPIFTTLEGLISLKERIGKAK